MTPCKFVNNQDCGEGCDGEEENCPALAAVGFLKQIGDNLIADLTAVNLQTWEPKLSEEISYPPPPEHLLIIKPPQES